MFYVSGPAKVEPKQGLGYRKFKCLYLRTEAINPREQSEEVRRVRQEKERLNEGYATQREVTVGQ